MAQPLKTRLTTQRNFKVAWVSFPSLWQSTGEKPTKRRIGLLGLMIPNVWVHGQLAPLPWAWKNVWNTATPSSWQLGSGAVKVWGWREPLTVLQQILTLCPTHCGLTSTLICCLHKVSSRAPNNWKPNLPAHSPAFGVLCRPAGFCSTRRSSISFRASFRICPR